MIIQKAKCPAITGHFIRNVIIRTSYFKHRTYGYIFFASSKNCANPISVKGCFNNPKIEVSGQVQTSAPNSAALMICNALRIEAASISVL